MCGGVCGVRERMEDSFDVAYGFCVDENESRVVVWAGGCGCPMSVVYGKDVSYSFSDCEIYVNVT